MHYVPPVYPREAQEQKITGTVVLRLHIDEQGVVYKAEKVSGPYVLVHSAIKAVKQWRYDPFMMKGCPVAVETTAELKFAL